MSNERNATIGVIGFGTTREMTLQKAPEDSIELRANPDESDDEFICRVFRALGHSVAW